MTEPLQPNQASQLPTPKFIIDPSLEPWNITSQTWLTAHQTPYDGLATGTIVFNNTTNKILLLQRAAHDSMPNKWEIPGGAVDDDDPSILHGAARELWEEAGLVAVRFTHVVGQGQVFMNSRRTRTFCRFAFVAEVEDLDGVRLDPNEHQDWLWAGREEVEGQRVGEREVPITNGGMRELILEAFRLRDERGKETG